MCTAQGCGSKALGSAGLSSIGQRILSDAGVCRPRRTPCKASVIAPEVLRATGGATGALSDSAALRKPKVPPRPGPALTARGAMKQHGSFE